MLIRFIFSRPLMKTRSLFLSKKQQRCLKPHEEKPKEQANPELNDQESMACRTLMEESWIASIHDNKAEPETEPFLCITPKAQSKSPPAKNGQLRSVAMVRKQKPAASNLNLSLSLISSEISRSQSYFRAHNCTKNQTLDLKKSCPAKNFDFFAGREVLCMTQYVVTSPFNTVYEFLGRKRPESSKYLRVLKHMQSRQKKQMSTGVESLCPDRQKSLSMPRQYKKDFTTFRRVSRLNIPQTRALKDKANLSLRAATKASSPAVKFQTNRLF